MRTIRPFVASLGAATALTIALAGLALGADPVEADGSADIGGEGAAASAPLIATDETDVTSDGGGAAAAEARVNLDPTAEPDAGATESALDGEAVADGDGAFDAAADDEGIVLAPESGNAAANGAGDACVRLGVFTPAGACAGGAPSDSSATSGGDGVNGMAKLGTAADETSTGDGATAGGAAEGCASLGISTRTSACGQGAAAGDGDEGASPAGSGTAPGAIAVPAPAGDVAGSALPDTAAELLDAPVVALSALLTLAAASVGLNRLRDALSR